MNDLLISLLSNGSSILAIIGVAALAALVSWLGGRISGTRAEVYRQLRKETRARQIADEVDNDIGALTPGQRRERLARWSRD